MKKASFFAPFRRNYSICICLFFVKGKKRVHRCRLWTQEGSVSCVSGFCLACLHDFFAYVFDICHSYIETITIIAAFINKKDPIPTEIKPCKQFSAAADGFRNRTCTFYPYSPIILCSKS